MEKEKLSFKLSSAFKSQIKAEAGARKVSMSGLIKASIRDYLSPKN